MRKWVCSKRGDCCREPAEVVMTQAERTEILARTDRILAWRLHADPRFVVLVAHPCPLLTADGRCSVYAVRPYNCRRFSCFREDGEPWAGEGGVIRKLYASRDLSRQDALTQRRAQRWARTHGWTEATA